MSSNESARWNGAASSQTEETHQRDERLVSAAKTGSTAAFSELFSLYSKNILKRDSP